MTKNRNSMMGDIERRYHVRHSFSEGGEPTLRILKIGKCFQISVGFLYKKIGRSKIALTHAPSCAAALLEPARVFECLALLTQLGTWRDVVLGHHDVLSAGDAVEVYRGTCPILAVVVTLACLVLLSSLGEGSEKGVFSKTPYQN